MPFLVTMPKLSPTMEEGVIEQWHVKEGEFVEPGALLFEVSTDKATVEHFALDEGYLRKILVKQGGTALVADPVAIFAATKEEKIDDLIPKAKKVEKKTEAKEEVVVVKSNAPVFKPAEPLQEYQFKFPQQSGKAKASPLAKKLAKEQNLDLCTVQGTGPGGRIMSRDLSLAQSGGIVSFSRGEIPEKAPGSYTEEAMTSMRKTIGKRLQEAKTFIPHFYVTQTIDAEPLYAIREQLKSGGISVTYNDFIIRATALALKQMPRVNCGYNSENNSIVHFETIDIAVAVTVTDGLITPIIRFADYKSLGEISVEVKELATRAKSGKLNPSEYQGGSFTISNLGMYGITEFSAIINPPQAAILAVGGLLDRPVVKNGAVVPGKEMSLTLSADHRIIDGALAAEFLRTLKEILEKPALLIV